MNSIGERIKYLRTKHNLSMEEFANIIGTNKSGISSYENNKYEPSAKYLIQISKHFGVSIDWILTGEGKGPDDPQEDYKDTEHRREIEGFEQTVAFLSNIIKEGKISREDLLRILFDLQYEMQSSEDEDAIYQEFVNQYEYNLLQNYRLLSEREQGRVDQIVESMVPKSDKKKDATSSASDISRDEVTAGDETEGMGIA